MIQEIKYNGYTTTPSDYESPDGDLTTSLNIIHEDGELHPLQRAASLFTLPAGYTLILVHKTSNYTHFIVMKPETSGSDKIQKFYYLVKQDSYEAYQPSFIDEGDGKNLIATYTNDPYRDITAMGNVITLAGQEELHYFMWYADHYEVFSQSDLAYSVEIKWTGSIALSGSALDESKRLKISLGDDGAACLVKYSAKDVTEDGSRIIWNAINAKVNELIPNVIAVGDKPEYWFKGIVFGVAALRLYDGSRIRISDIFMLLPESFSRSINYEVTPNYDPTEKKVYTISDVSATRYIHSHSISAKLNNGITEGVKPIVAGIDIFLTEETSLFEIDSSYEATHRGQSGNVFGLTYNELDNLKLRDHIDQQVFRLARFISLEELNTEIQLEKKYSATESISLANFQRNGYTSEHLYTYNNRLNLANLQVSFFNPDKDVHFIYPRLPYYISHEPNGSAGGFFTYKQEDLNLIIQEQIPYYDNERNDMIDCVRNVVGIPMVWNDTDQRYDNIYSSGDDTTKVYTVNPNVQHIKPFVDAVFVVDFDITSNIRRLAFKRKVSYPIQPFIMFPSRKAKKITIYFSSPLYNESSLDGGSAYQHYFDKSTAFWKKEFTLIQSGISDFSFLINRDEEQPRGKVTPLQVNNVQFTTSDSSRVPFDTTGLTLEDGEYVGKILITQNTISGLTYINDYDEEHQTYLSTSSEYDAAVALTSTLPNSYTEPNVLRYSDTNNPFSFSTTGTVAVGTGAIKGLCAAAKAMSPGQFGQFPLYAFTEEGVWALEVASNGAYSARSPITADVVLGNGESITQLEQNVLFATDRGIMMLSGSQTQCISDEIFTEHPFQLSKLARLSTIVNTECGSSVAGALQLAPFRSFLAGCRMLFDYPHQRIIIYNPPTVSDQGVPAREYFYAYVYSLKDRKWGMQECDIRYAVNAYPDMLGITDNGVITNISKVDPLQTSIKGVLLTRPIKLGSADIMKTIDNIIQRGYFPRFHTSIVNNVEVNTPPIKSLLYASRDMFNWVRVWSSKDHYLRGFSGTPYKYFRIALLCDMKPEESIYGCSVQYEPKITNQPR